MGARRGWGARTAPGLLALGAVALGLLAGAQGEGGSDLGTSISAIRHLTGRNYKSWQAAQDGVYGIIFTTESCRECANVLNAIEAAHFSVQQTAGSESTMPFGVLDAEPGHSGMEWAMEELGLKQQFPSLAFFKGGANEDKELVFKVQGALSKSQVYNLVMKLQGNLLFPRSVKDVSKLIRNGSHKTFIYAEDPEDSDAERKEDMVKELVQKRKSIQLQKIGGKGRNAKDWEKIKKKFGISQTSFISAGSEFTASLRDRKTEADVYTSFESAEALDTFFAVNSVGLVHWDDEGENNMLAMERYTWAREDPKRPGSDGLVTFWFNHGASRSRALAVMKTMAPLAEKFPNLIFVLKTMPNMLLEPCFDYDKGKWMYQEADINSIGIADIRVAKFALKATFDTMPRGQEKFVSEDLFYNPPLHSLSSEMRKYPAGWGIPLEEKAKWRGTSFDAEEVAQKLQQLLDRSPEL